jgi:N-methylhydantoinase A/oxoprolinase/acetone carboxylase beta subunit
LKGVRIGIDVGGTNTDAAAMDGTAVLGFHKTPTTRDVTRGIVVALTALLEKTQVSRPDISAVMIGTTHFTNAIVEIKRLLPTAAVRVALPATQALPPMVGWPDDLRRAIGGHTFLVPGGSEYDGRDLAPFDELEVRKAAAAIKKRGLQSVAITGVFSPVKGTMEERAAEIIKEEIPGVFITLSSEIGRIGLLERENAAILNGCLRQVAAEVVGGFRAALDELHISSPFFFTQNDGTLMNSEFAERYPVLTLACGPTNSMRGAAFLSGLKDAVVVDVGGTTSDVGMLVQGFPREASRAVQVGQIRTNFRMPDVLSIGLGGGSIVRFNGAATIGPDSVGYELETRARVFGGDTMTVTDIAVAAGTIEIGDSSRVSDLKPAVIESLVLLVHQRIDDAIGRVKTSAAPVAAVLVGGGALLVSRALGNASEIHRPPNAEVANAIGAAIAQVGGQVDRVFSLAEISRNDAIEQAKSDATDRAVEAGAAPHSVEIVEVDEVPLTYLPGSAVRIRVRAVGDLNV